MQFPVYIPRLPRPPRESHLEQVVLLISKSKQPVLYVVGGCLNSSKELRKFVDLTGIPVACTLMGLGSFPCSDELSLHMLNGTVYANYAVDNSDLLLVFGVRFEDRVTRKLEAFMSRAKIVHIDIDSAEIGKNKQPHVFVCADIKPSLQGINELLQWRSLKAHLDFSVWRVELDDQRGSYPLGFKTFGDAIPPQNVIQLLDKLTNGGGSGIGQHQMWVAQFYNYRRPRQWRTSSGLGVMGFCDGTRSKPDETVVDSDGDRSFILNVQELATARVENLPVKILLQNNQHMGMVVQWEDRFYKANRAHTYLQLPRRKSEIFPNFLKFA